MSKNAAEAIADYESTPVSGGAVLADLIGRELEFLPVPEDQLVIPGVAHIPNKDQMVIPGV